MANAKPSSPGKTNAGSNKGATMDLSKTNEAVAALKVPTADRSGEGLTDAEIEALGTPKEKGAGVDPDAPLTRPEPLSAEQLADQRPGKVKKIDGRKIVQDVMHTKGGPVLRHTYMDTRKA